MPHTQATEVPALSSGTEKPAKLPTHAPVHRPGRLARVLKRALFGLLALAAIGGIVVAWLPEPIAVDLAQVERLPLEITVDEDGRTRVRHRYVVSAPLMASISRIELEPGSVVEPGQVLARLLPLEPPLLDARTRAQNTARVAAALATHDQAQTSVKRVQAALQFARDEAARERALSSSGVSAERAHERAELEAKTLGEELASAQFAARVADYEVQMARLALQRQAAQAGAFEQIEIRAPIGGHVLRVLQQSAGVVQPGTPLLELGDVGGLEVVADVLTSEAVQIKPGARAFIEHWGGEPALRAHVRSVEPSAFTRLSALGVEEQRVNVVLDLDEPRAQWASLGDGYRVEVRMVVWQGQDVLSVPSSAVFRHRDQWASFVVRGDHAERVTLELGRRNGERVEIRRGLRVGERVVIHPSDRLTEGARVVPR